MPTSRALRRRMLRFAPTGLALTALLGAAALGPATVLAAGPATTTVTVSVVADDTHDPVDGALVTLTGNAEGDADVVYEDDRTTDGGGQATFTAVPLESGGAGVTLTAEATKSESSTADGCTTERTWSGASEPTPAAAGLAIEVLASRDDETRCDDPGPDAPVLTGVVVGPDGGAFAVFEASVAMVRADGAAWGRSLEIGADGRFSAGVQAWGTADAPSHLSVQVNGAVVGHETEGDCTYDLAPRASYEASVALADGHDPSEIALVASIERVGGVCGTTGTPKPTTAPPGAAGGRSTPAATLPPTDVTTAPASSDAAPLIAAVLVLGSAAGLTLLRRSGRDSG
ncbi:MAG TPA: hypothetical protein VGK63_00925 [Candidatus Limnocylindrales bacterium]